MKGRNDLKEIVEQFVDYLAPELKPYEASVYLYLFRNSLLKAGSTRIRIGERTIAAGHGKGSRGKKTNFGHVSEVLKSLEAKGCIKVGDTDREGTLYTVILPKEVPAVAQKLSLLSSEAVDMDYFNNPRKRREIFTRDGWICQYCGEKVTPKKATLDHVIPLSKNGRNNKENLRTCCLVCNSIKSGRTFEEAAPLLLASIQRRRSKSGKK